MNLILSALPLQIYSAIIITVVLSIIIIIVGCCIKRVKPEDKVPVWMIPFIILIDLINKMSKENLGKFWKTYAPYFLTLAIYLFISNIAGIFGLSSPTSYILVNAVLAIITFFIIQITAIASNGFGNYIKGFFEPIFILFPINLMSEVTLPISLALRLLGNIMSGAVLSKMIIGLAGWASIPFLPIFNLIFDIFFGLIQTAVFLLLSIMFTGMKVSEKDMIIEETK